MESSQDAAIRRKLVGGGPPVVLVVDDEEQVRRFVVRALEGAGLQVREAEHGRAALELLAQSDSRVDLVITDVVMPVMNGTELAEALGRLRPDLPVVLMSGYGAAHLAGRGLLQPNTSLLAKPFTPEALLAEVREALVADGR